MTIQAQLAQSQVPLESPSSFMDWSYLETSGLGSPSLQRPITFVGTGLPSRIAHTPAIVEAVIAPESSEMGWLVRHADELGQHKGEWLLILGTQLVVHNPDFAAVRAAVRQRQIHSPFVYYVPTDDESDSVTI